MPEDTKPTPDLGSTPLPGQTVSPRDVSSSSSPSAVTPAQTAGSSSPVPEQPSPAPPSVAQSEPSTQSNESQQEQKEFFQTNNDEQFLTDTSNDPGVTWTASEYIEHEKNAGWYLALALVAIVITAVIYLVTRDITSSIVVIVCAAALGFYGARPPRQLTYRLDDHGLTIGHRQFPYDEFRSFAIVPEDALNSIVFVHHKRFAPLTTIYPAPDHEEEIIDVLSQHLPVGEHKIDLVEHLMRRIRF